MNVIKQTVIILLAAGVIILGGLWLAETDWADGMRGNTAVQIEGAVGVETDEEGAGTEDLSPGMQIVFAFIRELISIGIPGIITLIILKLVKQRSGTKRNLSKNTKRISGVLTHTKKS